MGGQEVSCRVCGEDLHRGEVREHASLHRAAFHEKYGREPEDYDEVVELLGDQDPFGGGEDEQTVPLTEWRAGE